MAQLRDWNARKDAMAAGLKRYRTEYACTAGHTSERLASNGSCIECANIRNRKRRTRHEEKDKIRARDARWRANHPDRYQAKMRKWRTDNPDYHRLRSGLPCPTRQSPDCCEICGRVETKKHPRSGKLYSLALDHCHSTGDFRGWLCQRCNLVLGRCEDSAELFMKMAYYLAGFEESCSSKI